MFRMENSQDDGQHQQDVSVVTKPKRPSLHKVIMHNDDYTTMEFVIECLTRFFQKSHDEAEAVMLEIHHKGQAVCGVYTYEVAESKVNKVTRYARDHGHPLRLSTEPES